MQGIQKYEAFIMLEWLYYHWGGSFQTSTLQDKYEFVTSSDCDQSSKLKAENKFIQEVRQKLNRHSKIFWFTKSDLIKNKIAIPKLQDNKDFPDWVVAIYPLDVPLNLKIWRTINKVPNVILFTSLVGLVGILYWLYPVTL